MEYVEVQLAKILSRVEKYQLSLRGVIDDALRNRIMDKSLIPVILAMGLGVLRNYKLLDFISMQALGIKPSILSTLKKWLLRIIVYEVKFRWNVLDEEKIKRIKRLIEELNIDSNSIEKIREYNYHHELSRVDKVTKLSILYSQPKWIVKYLLELLKNPVECEELLKRLNEPPTIWIRANTLKIKVDDLVNILRRRGVRVIKDKDIPYALKVIKGGGKLTSLPEYKQGLYHIQDKSSMIVIHNLKPGENAIIYDLCSAPGGKASLIIQLTNGNAYLVGVDISLHRIKVEKIMLNRLLGPKFIGDLIQGDSTTHLLHTRRAYIVLVDPDCSALGKLGHSPEIRLWIRRNHIKYFTDIQYKLLKNACKLVKRGGTIAYSTCTFTLEENEGVVNKVIEEEGLEIVEPELKLGDEGMGIKYARRFYPHKHDVQGFFYVLLKK